MTPKGFLQEIQSPHIINTHLPYIMHHKSVFILATGLTKSANFSV